MKENGVIMDQARSALSGRWGVAIAAGVCFLAASLVTELIPYLGWVVSLLIGGPFALGMAGFSLGIARGEQVQVEQVFDGFKRFEVALEAYLRIVAWVALFLLLLIIPGIYKALQYSQTFYILFEDNTIKPTDAMEKSKQMMDGHEIQLLWLVVWFVLLACLSCITLFIGLLWLIPYMNVSYAKFYEALKTKDEPVINVAPGF